MNLCCAQPEKTNILDIFPQHPSCTLCRSTSRPNQSLFWTVVTFLLFSPCAMDAASDMETHERFGALCTRVKGPCVYHRTVVSFAYLLSEFSETDAKAKARQHLYAEGYDDVVIMPWRHPALPALNVSNELCSLRKTDGHGTGLPPLWPPNCPARFARTTPSKPPGLSRHSRDGPYTRT